MPCGLSWLLKKTSKLDRTASGFGADAFDSARAMAHAAFGLINSTPHSALLPDARMRELLTRMATSALGVS